MNLNDLDIYFSAITIYHNSHVFPFLNKIVWEKSTWNNWFSALFLSLFLCPKKVLQKLLGVKNWLLLALSCFFICFYWFKATENALMAYILNLKTYILIGNNNNKKTVALIIRFSLIKQKRNVWLVHKLYSIGTPSTLRLTTGVSFLVDSIGISPGHSAKCFLDAQL